MSRQRRYNYTVIAEHCHKSILETARRKCRQAFPVYYAVRYFTPTRRMLLFVAKTGTACVRVQLTERVKAVGSGSKGRGNTCAVKSYPLGVYSRRAHEDSEPVEC